MHNLLYEIITKNYDTGNIPEEFGKSRNIDVYKKGITIGCSNNGTISILNKSKVNTRNYVCRQHCINSGFKRKYE